MSGCLNFGLHLDHLFLLVGKKRLTLVVCIFLLKCLDSFSFPDLECLEFLSIIHSLVDSLIDSDKLLIVLHDLQLGIGLDLSNLHSSVEFAVKGLHLLLVLDLQVLDPDQRLVFVFLEFELPVIVEVLHVLVADLHILAHLRDLDVGSQFVLVLNYLGLQETDLFHKILVQLVFVDFAALCSEQLHFFLDESKD